VIPFQKPADNETFNRRRFAAQWWWSVGRDCQHFAAERGRTAISQSHFGQRLDVTVDDVILDVPFLASPHETRYRVQLAFTTTCPFRDVGADQQYAKARVSTHDAGTVVGAGGSHTVTGNTMDINLAPRLGETFQVDGMELTRLPILDLTGEPWVPDGGIILSDWIDHACDPALLATRAMQIRCWVGHISSPVFLSGIYAVGYSLDGDF